ncbi:MAG TPA: competence/damage-inducible protein A [Bacteroidales bacterium]|nr:competence/damage-inducible protein A [Bacteroidales bacterium]
MKAIIITIGDELLIGQTIDTNSAWIGSELSRSGFDVIRIISIHDRREDILTTLGEVTGKADVVAITGGLGPTSDDITKQTLCEFFNTRLITNKEILKHITEMLKRRNFIMNDNNRRQAEVPENCRILNNERGTAPGMWFEKEGTVFISMPGVPYEMKYLMSAQVIPELNKRFTSQVIIHKNIMTYGSFEARLAEMLSGFESELPSEIRLAYLPSSGIIKLRLTATGTDRGYLEEIVEKNTKKLYDIIPQYIYAEEEEPLEKAIGKLLLKSHKTICTAESCTGGEIAHMITSVPGSSAYYNGSVIAYANTAKREILSVPASLLEEKGAVSEDVVRAMAEGARNKFHSDYSIATSGIAGPDGGTAGKPVGTVWIAVASEGSTTAVQLRFGNDRQNNITRFTLASLDLLRREIAKTTR